MFCVLGSAFPQEPAQFESLLASAQQAQARSDFESAAEFYRKAINLHPEIPELKANIGLMYYQLGKDPQAIEAFSQAIRLKPELFVPNLFLGLDYVKLKRFKQAVPYLKRAVLLNPTDIQARLALGHAYTGVGKTRLATESYSRVAQLDPKNADGWFHLGLSYLNRSKPIPVFFWRGIRTRHISRRLSLTPSPSRGRLFKRLTPTRKR